MRLHTFLLTLLFPSFACFAAADTPAAHEHSQLEERMEEMSSAFKKLRRQVGDASKNENSLELLAKIRKESEASVNLVPAKAAELPEAERAKMVQAYQAEMKKLIDHLTALETALKGNNNAEAQEVVNKLAAQQKSAHREFRKPKD